MEPEPVRDYGDELALVVVTRAAAPGPDLPLDSVRVATRRPVRVLVVDTAGTAVPAGVEVLRLGEDVGRAAAANRAIAGLDPAVGWVALAGPGVQWCPGALDVLLDAGARHPRAGALGPLLRDARERPVPSSGPLPSVVDVLRGRIPAGSDGGTVGWVSGSCVLLRRAAWDSVDGFDPRYPGAGDDVDLGDRLGRAGWLVRHVPEAEVRLDTDVPTGGMLEPPSTGLRRYAHDRRGRPVRALLALAARLR